MANLYKNIGSSAAAVMSVLAIAGGVLWYGRTGTADQPRPQDSAEIKLGSLERNYAIGRTNAQFVKSIPANVIHTYVTNSTHTATNPLSVYTTNAPAYTMTNTVGLMPDDTYADPNMIRAAIAPNGNTHWLVPSNTFFTTGDWDGNTSTWTNFPVLDSAAGQAMWTNWITLTNRTVITQTNYDWAVVVTTNYPAGSTNYITITNNYHSITNYYTTNFYNAWNGGSPVMAFERDNDALVWRKRSYSDMGRALSAMQWQRCDPVIERKAYKVTTTSYWKRHKIHDFPDMGPDTDEITTWQSNTVSSIGNDNSVLSYIYGKSYVDPISGNTLEVYLATGEGYWVISGGPSPHYLYFDFAIKMRVEVSYQVSRLVFTNGLPFGLSEIYFCSSPSNNVGYSIDETTLGQTTGNLGGGRVSPSNGVPQTLDPSFVSSFDFSVPSTLSVSNGYTSDWILPCPAFGASSTDSLNTAIISESTSFMQPIQDWVSSQVGTTLSESGLVETNALDYGVGHEIGWGVDGSHGFFGEQFGGNGGYPGFPTSTYTADDGSAFWAFSIVPETGPYLTYRVNFNACTDYTKFGPAR